MDRLAGRYRVGEVLGHGGNATVRYGFDTVLKRPVAIKMFDGSAAEVLREARTAAGLSHPNIAQVYDYGEIVEGDERTPYLVMEFVGGETLADRLARTGALRWRRVAEIGAQTAGALAAAHAQSLVHRDVHPRNIMLTPDGVKVLDFGIAAVAGQHGIDAGGALWGSPAYLAPEQLRGEPSFPAGDVYALGLLLFESLTGSRAWPGETIGAILATRHGRPAPRLPRLAALPRELVRLYEACTADDPTGRPTAAEVSETLRRVGYTAPLSRPATPIRTVLSPHTVAAASPATRRRSRRRTAVLGSAAVVTAILGIVGVQLSNGTVTPGGREAEAAVEAPQPPASLSPSTSPPASPTTSARPRRHTETTTTTVRRKTAPPTTAPTTVPTSAPTTQPTAPATKPAPPSSPPPTTPRPQPTTPSPTPDDPKPTDPKPTEPTTPVTTPPTQTTPPTTGDTDTDAAAV
ncbi:serine/threonine-protein kinase [Paractinoplanes brasiliensis]|uniref:non-specific serine/threonine protein kinase n=1 Tax=Paractinoplanes brasiliensis TaxID=52695 RepID=A0A4R6JBB5_9ACTN|nr:serine/threonine-protein kinase [Actinoplanes brasiliensis]TDO33043.1 serine/threonine-protein kinase [Actinoplanes brasiliensis]GID28762.1 hypothetical protein Abr02nite_37450 [Actinoplanes brasiliensis]